MLLLASGASEIAPSQADLDDAVLRVCDDLCAQLQADAEGVTKRIAISVTSALTEEDAVTAARVIARDSLVKTALFGSDPNWGRVLAAVGMAPVHLDPDRITVSFNGSAVCIDGVGAPGAREVDLSATDIEVAVDLGVGSAHATIRTTDLSHATSKRIGLLVMTVPAETKAQVLAEALPWLTSCTARSWWSNTAATR